LFIFLDVVKKNAKYSISIVYLKRDLLDYRIIRIMQYVISAKAEIPCKKEQVTLR